MQGVVLLHAATCVHAGGAPALQLNVVLQLNRLSDFNKKVRDAAGNNPPSLSTESVAMANTVYVQKLTVACQLNAFTCPWQPNGQTITSTPLPPAGVLGRPHVKRLSRR